jgi:hypothetical protein
VNPRYGRVAVFAPLALVLLAASGIVGCNAILGIKSLSDDDGGTGAVLVVETGSPNAGPDAGSDGPSRVGPSDSGADDSSCGSCIGDTLTCLRGTCVACSPGAAQCAGNTPRICSSSGAWQTQPACGGTTPVCSNGICSSYRVTGGLRSTAPVPPGSTGIRLLAGGFEMGARACNDAGLCVTGGIIP